MEKEINIELKSEALNEVLSAPPSWLVRSGNTMLFVVIALVIGLSYLVSYPDELNGEAVIYNNCPPVEYQNQFFGKLTDLRVHDGQFVKKGTVIAQFDNTIHPKNIALVQSFLISVEKIDSLHVIPVSNTIQKIKLGSLQQNWITLFSQIQEWNTLQKSNLTTTKINTFQLEIAQRIKLGQISKDKVKVIEKELILQKAQTQSAHRLFAKNALSKEEVLQTEKNENQTYQALQNQRETIIQNEIQIGSLQKNLSELKFESQKQIQQIVTSIKGNVSILQTQLKDWEKNAAWVTPFDGKVLFNRQLNTNHFYKSGEASLVLVPQGNKYLSIVKIPDQGAGKVKVGQKVLIELSDFTRNDYGMLEGKVKSITSISKENTYEVEVSLPNSLLTTYNKAIPAKAVLKGKAKIITLNKRLLARFFENILVLIK